MAFAIKVIYKASFDKYLYIKHHKKTIIIGAVGTTTSYVALKY